MNVEALLLRRFVGQSQQLLSHPRILLPALAVAVLAALIPTPTSAQGPGLAQPKLTVAQEKVVRSFEKKLKTPLTSKLNPADRDTWYVIVFTDSAMGARKSRLASGGTVTTTYGWQATQNNAVRVVKGRRNAAILLLGYYYAGNAAASRLQPETNGKVLRQRAVAAKNWCYRAFATEEEAKVLHDLLNPET